MALLVGVALDRVITLAFVPRVQTRQEVNSGDGKYVCRITETSPWFRASPHLYKFSIVPAATGEAMTGTQFILDRDSATLPTCDIHWSGDTVQVTVPGYGVLTGTLGADPPQHWVKTANWSP